MYERGLFVNFEGIDGAGTSTHVIELTKRIEQLDKYQDLLKTHEPWRNQKIKEKLQEDESAYSDAEEMAELYIEDRTEHSYELIKPNLNAKVIVLSSRYKMSLAFQMAQGVSLDKLLKMHEHRGILTPDLNFLLDIPIEVAEERKKERGGKLEKFEKERVFIERVIENYKELIELSKKNPKLFGRVIRIDGNRPIIEVAGEIYQKFLYLYGEWKGTDFYYSDYYLKLHQTPKPNEQN